MTTPTEEAIIEAMAKVIADGMLEGSTPMDRARAAYSVAAPMIREMCAAELTAMADDAERNVQHINKEYAHGKGIAVHALRIGAEALRNPKAPAP